MTPTEDQIEAARTKVRNMLPPVLPGHWETAEGLQMAAGYAAKARSDLAMSDRTDLGLANALYLVSGEIVIQTAAKERMRWLSVQLALSEARESKLVEALRPFAATPIPSGAKPHHPINYTPVAATFADVERARAALSLAQPYEAEVER